MARREFVVDTSVVVDYFGGEPAVTRLLEQSKPVYIPVVVLGELLTGARKSRRVAENVGQIERFARRNHVLSCDPATADHYADIADQLRVRGTPIPQNDIWIAAVAVQHGLPLATRDAHFQRVDALLMVPC